MYNEVGVLLKLFLNYRKLGELGEAENDSVPYGSELQNKLN